MAYNGDLYDGAHEAIIDQATWDAVQRQIKVNGDGKPPRPPGKSGALLRGLITCGVCGAGMTTHASRRGTRKFIYYVCLTYQRQGASACPGSRAPIAALEAAVVDQIRAIGRDPGIVRETMEAAHREFKTRKPALQEELRGLERRGPELETERRNILDAIAKDGTKSGGLFEKLGEVEAELDRISRRTDEVRGEIAVLENQVLDEEDFRRAMAAFDPIWEQLITAERARILKLLIEEVRFNAREGEVEIVFRPGGIRAMAREETA